MKRKMLDMPSDFWSGWIIAITVTSLLGLTWFIFSTYFGRDRAENEPTQGSSTIWDGNLTEGARPPPLWWFWLMLASLVVTVVYLMVYPGLGSFSGTFQWTQGGQLDSRLVQYKEAFAPLRNSVLQMSIDEIQLNEELTENAERIFGRHCAACHGSQAEGQANRFPSLTDSEWQWGATELDIHASIRKGRQAVMTGWAQALSNNELNAITEFVQEMENGSIPMDHPGKRIYDSICVACHLADGTGQKALGVPDLTNKIYLYGGDSLSIKYSIAVGRQGEMPGFNELLDDVQIRLLVAWLLPRNAN